MFASALDLKGKCSVWKSLKKSHFIISKVLCIRYWFSRLCNCDFVGFVGVIFWVFEVWFSRFLKLWFSGVLVMIFICCWFFFRKLANLHVYKWDIFRKFSLTMNVSFLYKRSKTLKCQAICIFLHDFFLKPSSTVEKWKSFFMQNFFLFTVEKAPFRKKGKNVYWLLTCFSDGYYTVDLDVHPIAIFGAKHFEIWTVWDRITT